MDDRTSDTEFEGLMPIDALLCTLLEGSASADQKQEFLDLVEADPRFFGQSELILRLRGAIFGEELDLGVLQDFLGALSAEDGWDDFAETLRDQASDVSQMPGLDLTDSIMAAVGSASPQVGDVESVASEDEQALLISRLFDGDLRFNLFFTTMLWWFLLVRMFGNVVKCRRLILRLFQIKRLVFGVDHILGVIFI